MEHGRIGGGPMALAVAALLGGALAATPAAARDRGPAPTEADRRFDLGGGGTAPGPGTDRRPGAAAGRGEAPDPLGADAFERGYRAGRAAERAGGAAAGWPNAFRTGLAWNDAQQSEAHERLERAAAELRRALVLIGRQPTLPRVQGALVQAREALERTRDAMTWLPTLPDRDGGPRYPRVRGIGPERASGGWEG